MRPATFFSLMVPLLVFCVVSLVWAMANEKPPRATIRTFTGHSVTCGGGQEFVCDGRRVIFLDDCVARGPSVTIDGVEFPPPAHFKAEVSGCPDLGMGEGKAVRR